MVGLSYLTNYQTGDKSPLSGLYPFLQSRSGDANTLLLGKGGNEILLWPYVVDHI